MAIGAVVHVHHGPDGHRDGGEIGPST